MNQDLLSDIRPIANIQKLYLSNRHTVIVMYIILTIVSMFHETILYLYHVHTNRYHVHTNINFYDQFHDIASLHNKRQIYNINQPRTCDELQ
jgi:hypothetical protein